MENPERKKLPKPRGRRKKGDPVLLGPEPEVRPRVDDEEHDDEERDDEERDDEERDDEPDEHADDLDSASSSLRGKSFGVAPPKNWESLDGQILKRIDPKVLRQTPLPTSVAEVGQFDRGELTDSDLDTEPEIPEPPTGRKPKSLDDLIGSYPIGDGEYTIKVVRLKPTMFNAYAVSGEQVPIREPMDIAQFTREYGGGDYTLTVYGPPKKGGIIDPRTGRPRPKAVSPDVRVAIPWTGALGRDPIPCYPDDESTYESEDDDMNELRPNFRRPASPADAKIHETTLSHQERRELREREEQRQLEERAASASTDVLRLTTEVQTKSTERLLEQNERIAETLREERKMAEQRAERAAAELRRLEEQLRQEERDRQRAEANKPTPVGEMAQSLVSLVAAMRPDNSGLNHQLEALRAESERAKEALQREMSNLRDSHSREMTQMREFHAAELRREKEATERALESRDKIHEAQQKAERDRLKVAEERAERIAREATENAERRVREVEERTERRLREQREETDRRIADLQRTHEAMLNSEHRTAEREMRSLKDTLESRVEMERAMAQNQALTLQSELQRREAEVARVREEALAKGDFLSEFSRLKEVAGALGWQAEAGGAAPAEAASDWKTAAFSMGQTLVQNLPDILNNAANAVAASRGGVPPAQAMLPPRAQPPAPQLPPAPRARALPPPPGMYVPPPVVPSAGAFVPVPASQMPYTDSSWQAPAPPPAAMAAAPPPAPAAAAPSAAPPPPEPQPAPAAAAPPAAPSAPVAAPPVATPEPQRIVIEDSMIVSLREPFEDGYKLYPEDPAAFRATLIEQVGPDMVRSIAHSLDLTRMAEVLLSDPASSESPLLRQHGQTWLAQLLEICRQ